MAEKQAPSRRGGASTQNAPRRNDVIRCDKCGEYYATLINAVPSVTSALDVAEAVDGVWPIPEAAATEDR